MKRLFVFFLLFFCSPLLCWAKTLYVSGYRKIMLRRGPGLEYKIIATLETGDPVNLVREEGDFYLVSLSNGRQGYVLKSYLTEEVPAEHRLKELEEERQRRDVELRQLRQENNRLKAALAKAEKEAAAKARLVQELEEERNGLRQDRRLRWFLAGAGVLLVGWLLGWSRAKLRRQVRRSGLSF